jgi:ribosomal protein S18 acetylase RimI-like enzyme
MTIAKASLAHLDEVKVLLNHAAHRYADFGPEDLPVLLSQGLGAVELEPHAVAGFLAFQVEERPTTLPAGAPTRAQLRAFALRRHGSPAGTALRTLLPLILQDFFPTPADGAPSYPVQLLCYGGDAWMAHALVEAEFSEIEKVQFFMLDRLAQKVAKLPPLPDDLTVAPGHPDHLDELARLDARAFPPLWHFGRKDLFEMLMRCRVQVAWRGERIVGYAALCTNNRIEGQLARLAVDPALQGQGIGRALLVDTITAAAQEFRVLVLNTQVTNTRSQALYRGFGFRELGLPVPVYARVIHST